ncbi:hypothetical protein H8959_013341 [Pygathrix nigripes]
MEGVEEEKKKVPAMPETLKKRTQIAVCLQDQRYQWCEPKGPKVVAASLPSLDLQCNLCEAQQGFN